MAMFGMVTGAMSAVSQRCSMEKQNREIQQQIDSLNSDSQSYLSNALDNIDEFQQLNASMKKQQQQIQDDIDLQKKQFVQSYSILTVLVTLVVLSVACALIMKRFKLL